VLWVGPFVPWLKSAAAKQLTALHREIESWCRSLGLTTEDTLLTPHLAMARIKAGDREVGQRLAQSDACDRALSVGVITVGPLVLMKRKRGPIGLVYTNMWEVG